MELDPSTLRRSAYFGMYLMQTVLHGIAPDPVGASAAALAAAERACTLAPNDPEVLDAAPSCGCKTASTKKPCNA